MNNINYDQIRKKSSSYESFCEFRIDLSWFIHNCQIVYSQNTDIFDAAQQLLKFVDEEIISVTNCTQCYENAYKFRDTSFTMSCATPHLLVWAKAPGYVFWPAKAMSAKDGKIHVRFFGDHTTFNAKPSDCYLFSIESPDRVKVSIETYAESIQVSKVHQNSLLNCLRSCLQNKILRIYMNLKSYRYRKLTLTLKIYEKISVHSTMQHIVLHWTLSN